MACNDHWFGGAETGRKNFKHSLLRGFDKFYKTHSNKFTVKN